MASSSSRNIPAWQLDPCSLSHVLSKLDLKTLHTLRCCSRDCKELVDDNLEVIDYSDVVNAPGAVAVTGAAAIVAGGLNLAPPTPEILGKLPMHKVLAFTLETTLTLEEVEVLGHHGLPRCEFLRLSLCDRDLPDGEYTIDCFCAVNWPKLEHVHLDNDAVADWDAHVELDMPLREYTMSWQGATSFTSVDLRASADSLRTFVARGNHDLDCLSYLRRLRMLDIRTYNSFDVHYMHSYTALASTDLELLCAPAGMLPWLASSDVSCSKLIVYCHPFATIDLSALPTGVAAVMLAIKGNGVTVTCDSARQLRAWAAGVVLLANRRSGCDAVVNFFFRDTRRQHTTWLRSQLVFGQGNGLPATVLEPMLSEYAVPWATAVFGKKHAELSTTHVIYGLNHMF